MPSFTNKKRLRFVVTLGTGTFGQTTNDRITLEGFRATADIDKAGGMMMGTLRARVYGVKQQDMNSITTLQWKPNDWIPNTVEVYAIDGPAETLVFAGNIVNAWADYQSMPDVFLQIQAQSAYFNALKSVPPRSFKGAIDVASAMAQIARDMGLTFENTGVTAQLSDVYLPNVLLEQARDLARMVPPQGLGLFIDDKTLAITPSPTTPRGSVIPLISADTGLVGYPTFDGIGVNINVLFNPGIVFGGQIKIVSDVQQAAGQWQVASMAHHLESEKPGGAWFSYVRANASGLAVK